MRIIGIDPGCIRTGVGIIDCNAQSMQLLFYGVITTGKADMAARLLTIHNDIKALIARFAPDCAAIEQVFVGRSVSSALKLGQARGAALCALAPMGKVAEYAPRQIKQALTGHGGADKQQVQLMVQRLLQMPESSIQADAADALATAICHWHHC